MVAMFLALWLQFDINLMNRSTGQPSLDTYRIMNESWSTWEMSGVESTEIEKYLACLISVTIVLMTFSGQ